MIKKFAILDKILSIEDLKKGYEILLHSFDKTHGGFGRAPKYLSSHKLFFLLKYYKLTSQDRVVEIVTKSLDSMYAGGVFDHIGFGFFSKSNDECWTIPSFEKSLYDNSFIIAVYLEVYEITKDYFYKDIANKTLEYIFRELRRAEGGFYSSQEDINKGDYYLFNISEIISVLGREDGALFCVYYNITTGGSLNGKSVPTLLYNKNYKIENIKILELSRKLLHYRKSRMELDVGQADIVLSNGMLLFSLGKAYKIIGDNKYLKMADNIIDFICSHIMDKNGDFKLYSFNFEINGPVNIMEYGYFLMGLIEMWESSLNMDYLNKAIKLNEELNNSYSQVCDTKNIDIKSLLNSEIINPDFVLLYCNEKINEIICHKE